MDNVIDLKIANDAEQADAVLDQSKGQFQDVLVIGWNKNGDLQVSSSDAFLSAPHRFFILECAKRHAVNTAFEDEG